MKKLFLGAMLFTSSYLFAMQAPTDETISIEITEPQKSKIGNLMQICALDGENLVGYITFRSRKEQGKWEITVISVHQAYRKNHIAQELMQECIKYIKSQDAKLLVWKAFPLDHTINLHTLIIIYRRLLENAGYTMDSLTLGRRKESGSVHQVKMRLEL